MLHRGLIAAILTTLALPVLAQVDCGTTPCSPSAPQFASYPATEQPSSPPAPVDLKSHPRAKRFRSALRTGTRAGPNFAGAYTLVTWGCGVACEELAIVSTKNGKVFFPKAIRLNAYHVVHEDPLPEPFQFRVDSTLLVVVGAPNDGEEKGVFFYRWNGHDFVLVHKELRTWQ